MKTNFWRFRSNIFGKVILQRAYHFPTSTPGDFHLVYEDATVEDLKDYYTKDE